MVVIRRMIAVKRHFCHARSPAFGCAFWGTFASAVACTYRSYGAAAKRFPDKGRRADLPLSPRRDGSTFWRS
jgi:hypothetical protein